MIQTNERHKLTKQRNQQQFKEVKPRTKNRYVKQTQEREVLPLPNAKTKWFQKASGFLPIELNSGDEAFSFRRYA